MRLPQATDGNWQPLVGPLVASLLVLVEPRSFWRPEVRTVAVVTVGTVFMLFLTACSDTPAVEEGSTSLGISLGEIQSEFPVFDFEPLPLEDGRSATIARKFPKIAELEIVEFALIGPEHDLTEAVVLFSTEIDWIDALDVGAFIYGGPRREWHRLDG